MRVSTLFLALVACLGLACLGPRPPTPPTPPGPDNLAPEILRAYAEPAAGFPRTTPALVAEAIDPDGDHIWFEWSQASGPAVAIVDANGDHAEFTSPTVTVKTPLAFQVLVGDSRGAESTRQVSYTASPRPYLSARHQFTQAPLWPGLDLDCAIRLSNLSPTEALTNVRVRVKLGPYLGLLDPVGTEPPFVLTVPEIAPGTTHYLRYRVFVDEAIDRLPTGTWIGADITVDQFIGEVLAKNFAQIVELPQDFP